MINTISQEQIQKLELKFQKFDHGLDFKEQVLWKTKEDPSLFAYFFFKNLKKEKFKVYPYQDLILNDKSNNIFVCIARQVGKSTLAAILALHYAFYHDNATVVVVSDTKPQSVELIRRMKLFLNTSNFTFWKTVMPKGKESKTEIEIRNQIIGKNPHTYSRIISVPATDAARGYTADIVICDELAFWENSSYIFNQVVEPMVFHTKGKIIALTTPNGKQGIAWNLFNNPYYSVYNFDWRVCPSKTEEEMDKLRKTRTRAAFASEFEAKFIASQNAYFDQKDIMSAKEDLKMGNHSPGIYSIGVDFGKIQDNAVIMVGRIRNPDDKFQDQVIEVVDRVVKPLGTNYDAVVAEVTALNARYNPRIVFCDKTGVGESPTDFLRAAGVPVEGVAMSLQGKADLHGNLKLLFEQKRIKIPDEKDLIDQLEIFEYEYSTSGNIKLHAPEGGHDDEVDALALMANGLSTKYVPATLTIV